MWEGYDAIVQTRCAQQYIREHAQGDPPFCLFLSWGPPHNPYQTAPEKYRAMFEDRDIELRPNVPVEMKEKAIKDLRGYYAHIAALDDCMGELLTTLRETGLSNDTIVVFTSDHGDMLGSQGYERKLLPWDESAVVPFLMQFPRAFGASGRTVDLPLTTPDIMPTLLGLSRIPVPKCVEGTDFSPTLRDEPGAPESDGALFGLPVPYHTALRYGIEEYRGIRTRRHTYVETREGAWLLYDNREDPFQQRNLVGESGIADLQKRLSNILHRKLAERKDEFLPAATYVTQWRYNHMGELHGRYPAPGETPIETDETGWFEVVRNSTVKKHEMGCAVEASHGSGVALLKLPKPYRKKATVRVRYRSISEGNPRNAFLVLASEAPDRRQMWCGTFMGIHRHSVFQGPCKGTRDLGHVRSGSEPTAEFAVEVEVDVERKTVRLTANNDVLEMSLPADFDALRFVGCGVYRTASAFSRPEVTE